MKWPNWPPNFLPQRFPTQSVGTERKKRQKQRKLWVGLKMDLKKVEVFFVRQQLPAKTEKVPFRFISFISLMYQITRDTIWKKRLIWIQFHAGPLDLYSPGKYSEKLCEVSKTNLLNTIKCSTLATPAGQVVQVPSWEAKGLISSKSSKTARVSGESIIS